MPKVEGISLTNSLPIEELEIPQVAIDIPDIDMQSSYSIANNINNSYELTNISVPMVDINLEGLSEARMLVGMDGAVNYSVDLPDYNDLFIVIEDMKKKFI